MKENTYKSLYACISMDCLKRVIPLAEKYKYFTFSVVNSPGDIHSRYVVITGYTIMQQITTCILHLEKYYTNYYIIAPPDANKEYSIRVIEQVLKSKENFNFVATIIPTDPSRLKFAVQNIYKLILNTGNLVGKILC